jgi:elongation factor Ts
MSITAQDIKELRDKTGLSISKCKEALEKAEGDIAKAEELILAESGSFAAKKAARTLKSGRVFSYIHANGSMGVLLEMLCETDFVAKNEDFASLAKDIAMHITAMDSQADSVLEEDFIKNPEKKIQTLIDESIQKIGERIEIGRFTRFAV